MHYKEGHHPIFPFTQEEKEDIRKELTLKQSLIDEDVDAILEWFEKQPHLIPAGLPDRDFVEHMLVIAKGSREKTKRRIDNFYKHRALAPELIQNRRQYIDSNEEFWSFYRQIVMPKLYNLKRISIVEITNQDPNSFDTEAMMKQCIMFGDVRLKYDYVLGDIWIINLSQITLGHILRVNLTIFAKASRIFLDGFGIRLYAIHVLGAPSYAEQLQIFFSKFAKPKIMERLMFHNTVEELYEYVPREYLPKEYGGDEISLEFTKEKYTQFLKSEETKEFLESCSRQISDESRRPDSTYSADHVAGTFKKLDLD